MSGLSLNPYPKILITNNSLMFAPHPTTHSPSRYICILSGKNIAEGTQILSGKSLAEGTQILPGEFEFQALATSMM